VVELYEHQRYFPVVGWSTNLFPTDPEEWQDQNGNKTTKEAIQNTMPSGMFLPTCVSFIVIVTIASLLIYYHVIFYMGDRLAMVK
jgi:hypothetical protein